MVKKLELDSLTADLAAVEALLAERDESIDPIGWLQFNARKADLESEIRRVGQVGQPSASVALLFGGRPTLGSRGILADFGSRAIEQFQAIVTTQFAALEGPIGARGPLPQRERAQLMITDVARGSFGFVLEEAGPNTELVETQLKETVGDVLDLLARVASPDEEAFEETAEQIDDRVLGTLTSFVKLLDESGATLRLVDDEREFALERDALGRARERAEALNIQESRRTVTGRFYLLPDSKRFELHPIDGGESYRGQISATAANDIVDETGNARPGIIGEVWTAELAVREVRLRNRDPRYGFKLERIRRVETELGAPATSA